MNDYPDFAIPLARAVASGYVERDREVGIVIIGIVNHVSEIDHLMSLLGRLSGELLFITKPP